MDIEIYPIFNCCEKKVLGIDQIIKLRRQSENLLDGIDRIK